jgi:hypothetical protein
VRTAPPFSELIATTTRTAAHLETRDAYTPGSAFLDWRAGRGAAAPAGATWYDLVREHTARGVGFRRARVVSTRAEIAYARSLGKPVRFPHPQSTPTRDRPEQG